MKARSFPPSSEKSVRRTRLAILVNTIAPYRVPIYKALAERFDTVILHGGREANRQWEVHLPPTLKCHSVPTLQLKARKQTGVSGLWDKTFLHLNIGLLWWLPLTRPDAIFTNELGVRTMAALAYGKLARVPVWVGWEGSLHSERNIDKGRRWLRKRLVRHVEHWVSFGAQARDYLHSMGVAAERITEVQNCVEQEKFQRTLAGAEPLFPGSPAPLLLCVGQLIPRKGLDKLLDACGRAAARGEEFSLVFVGSGPERERLEEQAGRLGLKHIYVLPNQHVDMLNRLYRRADAMLLPSLEDVWGLVVSEALWAGLPVLCSQYAASAEVVPPENTFDPLSDASFDAALEKVLRGTLAAAETSRLMTWQEVSSRIGDAITRVMKLRGLRSSGIEALPGKSSQREMVS